MIKIGEINNLQMSEYIEITSTIQSIYYSQFNCKQCLNTFTKRPDYKSKQEQYDKLLEKKKIQKSCQISEKVKYQIEDIRYYKCIGNFYSDSAVYFIDLFYNYQRGVLPYPGSLMEQPAKIIEIFQIIDGTIKTKQQEIQKEQEQEASRKRR